MASPPRLFVAALLVSCVVHHAAARSVLVGPSEGATKDVTVSGVTTCSATPQNECCGELFDWKKIDANTIRIQRTDQEAGWKQSLRWECGDAEDPELHQPVKVNFYGMGANCREHHFIGDIRKRKPSKVVNTDQINLQNQDEFTKAVWHGYKTGTNWVGLFETNIKVEKSGKYMLRLQIGPADIAAMWVNDKKVIESKCWQKTAGAEVTLEAGYHTIDILFADDGWHDTLVFLYSGPDTEGNLRIVPGHVMHPSCPGPDDFLTKAMDCKARFKCPRGQTSDRYLRADQDRSIDDCMTTTTTTTPAPCKCSDDLLSNGECDAQCNTEECGFDKGFCRSCGTPDSPTNGAATTTSTTVSGKVMWSCDRGFAPSGTADATCVAADESVTGPVSWSAPAPACEAVTCGELQAPAPDSGLAVVIDGDAGAPHAFDTAATYRCTEPHMELEGPVTRTCGDGGRWSGSEPRCVAIDCDPFTVANGAVDGELLAGQGGVTITCKPGYQLSGAATRKCSADGWDVPAATCDPLSCDPLEDVLAALGDASPAIVDQTPRNGPSGFGSQARLACSAPFKPIAPNQATTRCLSRADGVQWVPAVSECDLAECPAFPDVEHGTVSFSSDDGAVSGSSATVACEAGYRVEGTSPISCTRRGEWDGEVPRCVPKLCPEIVAPANAAWTPALDRGVGATSTLACDDGYKLEGLSSFKCMDVPDADEGAWDSTDTPTCTKVMCPKPAVVDNARALDTSRIMGSVVVYLCKEGFRGGGELTCAEDGTWQAGADGPPACSAITCAASDLPVIEGADLPAAEGVSAYGTSVDYTCADTHKGRGGTAFCAEEGWEVTKSVNCRLRLCQAPSAMAGADMAAKGPYTLGSEAVYTCRDGFGGGGTLTCATRSDSSAYSWQGTATCEPMCTTPTPPEGANFVYTLPKSDNGAHAPGTEGQITCTADDTQPADVSTIQCQGRDNKGARWVGLKGVGEIECLKEFLRTFYLNGDYDALIERNEMRAFKAGVRDAIEQLGIEGRFIRSIEVSKGSIVVAVVLVGDGNDETFDTAVANGELAVQLQTAEGSQAFKAVADNPEAATDPSGQGSSTVVAAVVASTVVVVIVIAVIAVVLYRRQSASPTPAAESQSSFSNPAYDERAPPAFDEAAGEEGGYQEVTPMPSAYDLATPQADAHGDGYMDVHPAGEEDV